jgi:hypothetical protein
LLARAEANAKTRFGFPALMAALSCDVTSTVFPALQLSVTAMLSDNGDCEAAKSHVYPYGGLGDGVDSSTT